MLKIMKFDGSIVEKDIDTYDWIIKEVNYDLVYDKNGELFGVAINDLNQKILDDIVENPWNYDFPCTLEEYFG